MLDFTSFIIDVKIIDKVLMWSLLSDYFYVNSCVNICIVDFIVQIHMRRTKLSSSIDYFIHSILINSIVSCCVLRICTFNLCPLFNCCIIMYT